MKTPYELARLTHSEDYDGLYEEIFTLVKADGDTLTAIINNYVQNVTGDVFTIKETVRQFELAQPTETGE